MPDRDAILGSTVDIFEDAARQTPLRQLAQIFDAVNI
jgi:hypothetical protein